MKQADQATSIPDCLFVPDNLFLGTVTLVFRLVFVFLTTKLLVCLAHREDKEEGVGRSRHESEQLRLVNAEDVMECEFLRKTEFVDEGGHDLRIVFCQSTHISIAASIFELMSHPAE